MTQVVTAELRSLARQRVGDLVDADSVRSMIRNWAPKLIRREVVADLVIQANRQIADRLQKRRGTLGDLLDRDLTGAVDELFDEGVVASAQMEQLVEHIMRQEFIRRLFTDIVFTSIVSFNERVNPLFGAFAMRALEEQIKSFIRLFMPMLQRQATAFAISSANQRILRDFARAILRQVLEQPLRDYAPVTGSKQRKQAEALIRKAVFSPALESAVREATVSLWDGFYAAAENRMLGELLQLPEHAAWLAERVVDIITPALERPHVRQFIATEMALAAGPQTRIRANAARRQVRNV